MTSLKGRLPKTNIETDMQSDKARNETDRVRERQLDSQRE